LVVGISFLRKGKSDHLTKHFATFQQIAALLQMSEFSQRSQIASFLDVAHIQGSHVSPLKMYSSKPREYL
jgi:hypothetical protein